MSLPKQQGYRRTMEPRNRHNAKEYVTYLERKKVDELDIYYQGCGRNWDEDFMSIAKEHKKLNNNVAVEYVESWSPEETSRIGVSKLFDIGIANAKKAFPDHSFAVVPHINENGCFHTHVLYCRVSDSGKAMKSDWKNRSRWNYVCDKASKEHGLSTVEKTTSKQKERLSREARKIKSRGVTPYQLQIMQKADFARRISVNINEFISFMGDLGIRVHDKGKVLTYFHPARNKGVRDRKLGELYKKEKLIEQFRNNENEQKTRPNLKRYLSEQVKSLHDERGNLVGDKSNFPFLAGGHQKFEKQTNEKGLGIDGTGVNKHTTKGKNSIFNRSFGGTIYSTINDSIQEAKSKSIIEYCKRNRIALEENQDGSFALKGRKHILIRGNRWENIRSKKGQKVGTQGTLIEFVANHKGLTLLESIADITDNRRLLLLQNYLGKEERTYREFSIPFSKRKNEKESVSTISKLLTKLGYKSEFSLWLYKTKRVQVSTQDTIRFLLGNNNNGAVEYVPKKDGNYKKNLLGNFAGSFLEQNGRHIRASFYKDPFVFMKQTNAKGMMDFKSEDNVLVLGDSNMQAIDFFLAKNKSIKEIDLFGFDAKSLSSQKKKELSRYGIKVNFIDLDGKSRSKNKGLDLSL